MKTFEDKSKELNDQYIECIKEMRILNKKRFDIYNQFRVLNPNVRVPRGQVCASIYHDLYDNDLDKLYGND